MKSLAILGLGLLHSVGAFAAQPEVVALTGTVTPFGTITGLGLPATGGQRQTLFQAYVDPTAQPERSAILLHGPAGITAVAIEPQGLPGGQLDIENLFNAGSPTPVIDAAGDVVFGAEVGPVGSANFLDGLVRYDADSGTLALVVVDGDPAPDGHGQMFVSLLNRPVMSSSGEAGFYAEIQGATGGFGNGDALVRRGNGSAVQTARTAQPLPGGGSIDEVAWPSLNSLGQISFYATISGAGGGAAGIFRGNGTTITKIARTGEQPIPGWVINGFDPVEGVPIDNAGWVVFRAEIEDIAPFHTIFRGNGASTQLIAAAGQAVPGGTGVLRNMDRNVAINDNGQVAFVAGITDDQIESGIFRDDDSTLTTIAREDDLVPGTAAGFFTDFRNYPFALNDRGEVAFIARFQLGCCLQNGLFFYSDEAGLQRVVTVGEALGGGIVNSFDFVGTSSADHRPGASGLDDSGRVAFRFTLTNGNRGIAVFDGRVFFQDGFESGNTAAWSATVP